MIPIKCLKVVSTFRKRADFVVYEVPTEEAMNIKKSVEVIEKIALEDAKGNKGKDKKGAETRTLNQSFFTISYLGSASSKRSEKSKSSKDSKKGKQPPAASPLPDNSIWCDFLKVWQHVEFAHIYFKPSRFETNLTITDMPLEQKTGEKGRGNILLNHSLEPVEFRNEALYVFVDSIDYKLMVFNLCHAGLLEGLEMKSKKLQSTDDNQRISLMSESSSKLLSVLEIVRSRRSLKTEDETNDTSESKSVHSLGSFILEEYNWQNDKIGEVKTFLNSLGTKSTLITFDKGRLCFRLWIQSRGSYCLNILSDVAIAVGNLELILDQMTSESQRLTECCFNISSSYGRLVQAFGTPDYPAALKKFYSSYKPDASPQKGVHDALLADLLDFLGKTFGESDFNYFAFALRVLFLNTNIGLRGVSFADDEVDDIESFTSQDISILKEVERAAVTIQAFFRRIHVQRLKKRHEQTDNEYMKIFEALKKIYEACFSVDKRLSVCLGFMRSLLKRPEFEKCYSWAKDLESVVEVQSFAGTCGAVLSNWVPICRYVFHCEEVNVVVKIVLFGEIKQRLVRVFDNDNGREIRR